MKKIGLTFIGLAVALFVWAQSKPKVPNRLSATRAVSTSPTRKATTDSVSNKVTLIDGHPAWIMQGNIYEVNLRQYTPEGTIRAFEKYLNRLKNMGVQTLWFMPINPISLKDRKGSLGSYYAVQSYTKINPEFGTLSDWKECVRLAHLLGFKVIIDWVPNHTGADHEWLTKHPNFYVKDKKGQAAMAHDWADTRKLDYNNPELVDSMISALKFWIRESDIDGYRCDVAPDVKASFWTKAIAQLKKLKPGIFMLAEGDEPWLHTVGFDATYGWSEFKTIKLIAKGLRNATSLDSTISKVDARFPKNALRLLFTSNHDENSWNQADYGTMPGNIHPPFAVWTQTAGRSIPLIYSGQEEPVMDSISFFHKNTIPFRQYGREPFYRELLELRASTPALAANASFRKINVGNTKALYAYVRQSGARKVLVVLNLSNLKQQVQVKDASLFGKPFDVFAHKFQELSTQPRDIAPWGFFIYDYR